MEINKIIEIRDAKKGELAKVVNEMENLHLVTSERALTAEEAQKFNNLKLQRDVLESQLVNLNAEYDCATRGNVEPQKSKSELFREMLQVKGKVQDVAIMSRATTKTTNMAEVAPVTIEDVMQPLADNLLVYDKVGLKVQDAAPGTLQWPYVASVMATIADEDAALTDETIDLDKVTAVAKRIGITASVTNQAINSSDKDVLGIVSEQIARGLKRTLDKAILAGSNVNASFHGPAASALTTGTFAATVPTYKELLTLKGKVAAQGADLSTFCYVMSPELIAILEATPINANGGDRMIVEGGKIAGYPVYGSTAVDLVETSGSWAADSVHHVLAGCWEYLALCTHGAARLIIDPVSQAKKDKVEVTLNVDMSLTNLRTDSNSKYVTFARYKCHA